MDQRSIRTRKAIKTALINLMKTTSLPKISVTEVVRTAGITRATFYLHYQDIDNLYDSICDEILRDLSQILQTSYQDQSKVNYALLNQQLYDYLSQDEVIHTFLKNERNQLLLSKIKKLLIKTVMSHEKIQVTNSYSQVEIPFIISGAVDVYAQMITDLIPVDAQTAVNEMTTILAKF
ncbi:TetR family regulatory protein of MDR cluster [Fructilactobacillus florum 8D]|uniref:TetR family regulatory protein of MDR cluster n=2 Tax=Fructilactobacillus florum TaxID=640331 RepID=W9ELG1_9LACO|nr:TetR/AcrR family transcriptional regulator [Fructilactobacillus florum]ETO40509.1 TetR family regulatory protein of MDR cluster [Fructilactobacillus florum 8D]KRM91307.1 hypothetical protein FC87_GL001027 [Fructilactobacillus florum DSM 22689 = JCM 16035]